MDELAILIVVFGFFVVVIDQIRRLVSHVILNRTIAKALDKAPETVPLFVMKIEDREPWSASVVGWTALIFGIVFVVALFVSPDRPSALSIGMAVGLAAFGVVLLLSHRGKLARTDRGITNGTGPED